MEINRILQDPKYEKTLHELSLDVTHNIYVVESNKKAIDFDCIVRDLSSLEGLKPKCILENSTLCCNDICSSNDALIRFGENEFIFIEFKNRKINTDTKPNIKKKILCSNEILKVLLKENNYFIKTNCSYILVYTTIKNRGAAEREKNLNLSNHEIQDSNNKAFIAQHLIFKATYKYSIQFGLDEFISTLFKNAATICNETFDRLVADNFRGFMT